MKHLTWIPLALALAAAGCGAKQELRSCAPPRGPGDAAVHSTNLRADGVDCAVARRVALACANYTYGRAGKCAVLGARWRCTSVEGEGAESTQQCVDGSRSVRIMWTD